MPKFHTVLHASHTDLLTLTLDSPPPRSTPSYITISSKSSPPNITYIIQPSAQLLFSAAYSIHFTFHHFTFFTFQLPTLPPTYLYQKDERTLHGTLQSRYIFSFLFNKSNFTPYISPLFLILPFFFSLQRFN